MWKLSISVPIFNKNYSASQVFFAFLNTIKSWKILHGIRYNTQTYADIKDGRSQLIWLQNAGSWDDWQLPTTFTTIANNVHGNCQQRSRQLSTTWMAIAVNRKKAGSYTMTQGFLHHEDMGIDSRYSATMPILFALLRSNCMSGSLSLGTLLSRTASLRVCFSVPTSLDGRRWNISMISLPSMQGCRRRL